MTIRFVFLALASLLSVSALAPSASAAPDLPPLVDVCTQATGDCPAFVCVGISRQVPMCVDRPSTRCIKDVQACTGDFCDNILCPYASLGLGAPSVDCMDRYWRRDVGDVTVESRSSCEYQVYYQDKPLLQ